MPLLKITQSKKTTATITIESSTAILVDRYAAFTKTPADDVIDAALSYVFAKDKDFQMFLESPAKINMKPPLPLRIKRPTSPAKTSNVVESAAD